MLSLAVAVALSSSHELLAVVVVVERLLLLPEPVLKVEAL